MFLNKNNKSNSIIALDINKVNISVAQGEGKNLKAFNSIKTPVGIYNGNKVVNSELLQHGLKSLLEGISLSGKKVAISIPEENILKQTITVDANFDDREIHGFIEKNAPKFVNNINPEEYNFDYYKVADFDDDKIEINVFFIKKEELKIYQDALTILDLELSYVDIDYICLERLIKHVPDYSKYMQDTLGYFHVGKENTKVLFFKNGKKIFEYISEEYNYKSITEKEEDNKGAKASATGGIDLDIDVSEDLEEEENINEELSKAGKSFINFINSNIILIDTLEDDNFKIFCSVDEGELDFNYSDLDSSLTNINVFQSKPFEGFNLPKKANKEEFDAVSSKLSVLRGLLTPKDKDDTDVNLHNWRGDILEGKTKKFQTILGTVALIAGLVIFIQHLLISTKIKNQQARNSEIQKIINIDIEKEKDIEDLKIQKETITSKIETINALQVQRPNIVKYFTSVVNSTPKEVYLVKFNREKTGIIELQGKSTEEKKIFELIKRLEESEGFYDVKISQVTNSDKNKSKSDKDVINPYYRPEYDFILNMKEELAIITEEGKK